MHDSLKDAIDYFYSGIITGDRGVDRQFWGGYARFFEPHLPGRLGNALLSCIHRGLRGDQSLIGMAVDILSAPHVKRVNHIRGSSLVEVVCNPTQYAAKGIELLRKIKGIAND